MLLPFGPLSEAVSSWNQTIVTWPARVTINLSPSAEETPREAVCWMPPAHVEAPGRSVHR
jgi:hypothetical protein